MFRYFDIEYFGDAIVIEIQTKIRRYLKIWTVFNPNEIV